MKNFKFKYALGVYILLFVVLFLTVVGLIWNVLGAIEYLYTLPVKGVSSLLTAVLCLAVICLALAFLLCGKYSIKEDVLFTKLGFFTSKTKINQIRAITHFKKSDKLVVYFEDAKYSVIVISPEFYEQFITSIREINSNILYSSQIDGEDLI